MLNIPATGAMRTGYMDLDVMLGGGLMAGQMMLVCSRASMGKTSLLFNLATNAANFGAKVFLVSLEMPGDQVDLKILCSESGVTRYAIQSELLNVDEAESIMRAQEKIRNMPLYPVGVTNDADGVVNLFRQAEQEFGINLIVFDGFSMIQTAPGAGLAEEINRAARIFKGLAVELNCGFIGSFGLAKTPELRTNKRPLLSDLGDNDPLLDVADIVTFLYRDEFYHPDSNDKNTASLIIAKSRSGPTGTIHLYFEPELARFGNLMLE